jgi:aspartyl-tRNA(Asn)/glutamyl-tRNA(Gln) amidotransferase subunit A
MGAAVPISARPLRSFTVGCIDDEEIAGSASPAVNQHFAEVRDTLMSRGLKVDAQPSPVALSQLNDWHKVVFEYELARSHGYLFASGEGQVEQAFLNAIERGMGISERHYLETKGCIHRARLQCWRAWTACDVLMMPATPDIAPIGMATGDARYISPFTVLSGPLVAMPTGFGDRRVPLGTMLCAKPYEDNHLLACALSLATVIELTRNGETR